MNEAEVQDNLAVRLESLNAVCHNLSLGCSKNRNRYKMTFPEAFGQLLEFIKIERQRAVDEYKAKEKGGKIDTA